MKLLLVAATLPESAILRQDLGIPDGLIGEVCRQEIGKLKVALLHTGIGMVNTAYHLGRYLLAHRPDFALQFGIAGSFPGGPAVGTAVEVVRECYADLVAESPDSLLDLATMGFENFRADEQLYYNEIVNPHGSQSDLPACRGISVNRVHGRTDSIAEAVSRWQPEVESMEGAAFFQCCLMQQLPFMQLRGISNRVEPRKRENWEIGQALQAVQAATTAWIHAYEQRNRD